MAMLQEDRRREAREAEENLRVIRDLMERSTKYSTFSGLSGVLAGIASIVGCLLTRRLELAAPPPTDFQAAFLTIWSLVIAFALGADYLLTKRRAAQVGKRIVSRLGRQMLLGSAPGLGTGVLLTLFFLQHHLLGYIYSVWMLCYGIAVCAVGQFSQREVSYLGAAFLWAGAMTLLLPPQWGLIMMAVSFGGFHILYGLGISGKDGW
ncbi:MAG TPA: hypothetical protein VFB38_09275 [Chthonomonadaceae bacterium]|nr:hypothetical protein [Chthonomonadaceae bacterium]